MRECDNRVSLLRKFTTRSIVHPPSSLRCSIVRLRFVTSGDLAVNWKSLFPRFWNLSRPARSIIQEPVTKLDGNMKLPSKSSQSQTSLKTGADFHPAYSEILEGINNKLLNSESSVSNRADIVNKVVYDLLQHGEEWNKFRRTSLKKKIDHCILLDNFVPNVGVSMDARAKALQSHSKRSQKHMSRQQHRKCGSFDMPKEFHKFELFKPMHDMWKAYILELLEESNKKQLAQCLLTADLHGAFVVVVDCKTRSFVGMSGIMIRETAETFGIIKRDNHFRVVPKRGSVFIFQAGCWKVTLHGDKLSLRNIT